MDFFKENFRNVGVPCELKNNIVWVPCHGEDAKMAVGIVNGKYLLNIYSALTTPTKYCYVDEAIEAYTILLRYYFEGTMDKRFNK